MKGLVSVGMVSFLCVQAALLTGGSAMAQGRRGEDPRREARELKPDEKARLKSMQGGSVLATAQDGKEDGLLDKAAAWYVNRVTWVEYQIKEYGATDPR